MFARVLETEFAAVVDEHRVDVLDGRVTLDVETGSPGSRPVERNVAIRPGIQGAP